MFNEHQAGATAVDLCRKHGISDAAFYTWRSKYGGMAVSGARLKTLLSESMLNMSTLRVMLAKTSDARLAACSRDLGDRGERLLAASRLQLGGHRATDRPLCVAAAVHPIQDRFRDECLNEHLFGSLSAARRIIEAWRTDYNTQRRPTSLNGLTPNAFAARPRQGHPETDSTH